MNSRISVVLLLLLNMVIAVAGQLCLKVGMQQVKAQGLAEFSRPRIWWRIFTMPTIMVAVPLYLVAFLAWLMVLSRLKLSQAYPLMAVTYAIVPLASWLLLGDKISGMRWMGILLICGGVLLVARG